MSAAPASPDNAVRASASQEARIASGPSALSAAEKGIRPAIRPVIDPRIALLKNRREQQQRLSLSRPNQQLNGSGPELSATLDYFADRVDRRSSGRGTRVDLDLEPGFPVKALPQGRIITGELELRRAVKLQHELVCGIRSDRRRRQGQREPRIPNY